MELKTKIPKLPADVRYTEPELPKDPLKDANDTKLLLKEYEIANSKNKRAIESAQEHNKKLEKLYNKNKP